MQKTQKTPTAPARPHIREMHGERFVDNYFWLREKTNPAVRAYLEGENAYTDGVMKPTVPLQKKLYREIVGRIQETDDSVPAPKGDWAYYYRTEKGKQYRIHCRKSSQGEAREQVILDVNALAKGEKFMAVMGLEVSDNAQLLAYGKDNTGFRQYVLCVKDQATGKHRTDTAERVTSIAWAADNRTLFYTTEDPVTKRSDKLFKLVLGNAPEMMYEEKDERFNVYVLRSRDNQYLALVSGSLTASEWRLMPAARLSEGWRVVEPRRENHEYYLDFHNGQLFIWSNRSGRNFGVYTASVEAPGEAQWKEIVAHRPEVKIEAVHCFRDHYVIEERARGLPRFQIVRFSDGARHEVKFPEAAFVARADANLEFNTTVFRYRYEPPKTPDSVYDHDLNTGQDTLRKREPVLGGFDAANYEVERLWAPAKDGTEVPITLLSRKGTPRCAPMLLTGYGAYGIPEDPDFQSPVFSLVDRGVAVAIAHIRGGGDMGKPWHDAGRMENKMNTFTDFIACAEYLVRQGRTRSDQLAIAGGSAGGLLMGAVTNLRPDLFKAVVSYVPFVDVINTMNDESLPLTVAEFEEWGNPKIPDQYQWLRRYCPYTNLERKNYPAILIRTSFNDSQVMYWEPAKYVARLRTLKTDANPLLLYVNLAAGHGGSSGRYDKYKETAFDYAFVLRQLGVEGK